MSALPNPSLAVRSLSWPGLELRHLTAFHAVVDEGSFGRAARRLGYTQSAVSQQVAALERAVGRRLLTRARGGGRPALTTAGKIVLAHADAIARELAIARDALERLDTQTKQASLRIVMRYATGLGLTPLFLEGMHGATPHDIAISDGGSDCTMGDLVALGQADLALVEQPRLDLAFERLITEPYVVVMARRRRGDVVAPATREWLATQRLLMLPSSEIALPPGAADVFHADNPQIICDLASRDLGVAVVPRSLSSATADAAVVEIVEPTEREVYAVWQDGNGGNAALRASFVRAARDVLTARLC